MTITCTVIPLGIIFGCLSCESPRESPLSDRTSPAIDLRIVLEKDRCREDCEMIEVDSAMLGHLTLWVRPRVDLVLSPDDVVSITPVQLSSVSASSPKISLWAGTLRLTPEAAGRLHTLQSELAADDVILFSADGQPLSVTYAHLAGQMMALGEFSSRSEVLEKLGKYGEITQGTGEVVEVFSSSGLETLRRSDRLLEESEGMKGKSEEIEKLFDEGKISREEMIERLLALTSGTAEKEQ